MNPDDLTRLATALYGEDGWKARLAEVLGVDGSTVRRWASGTVPVPGPVAAAVRCFARERGIER